MSENRDYDGFTTFEEKFLNAWPALKTLLYKGCIIRLSNGYTKRANCANPLYIKQKDIDSIITFSERIYTDSKQPVIFKIIGNKKYEEFDYKLAKLNYTKLDLTDLMLLNISTSNIRTKDAVNIENSFSDEWLSAYFRMKNREDMDKKSAMTMLNNISSELFVASLKVDDKIIACGYGACEDEYVGLFDIMVDVKYRANGYGKELVWGLLNKAKEKDIKYAYLQVVTENLIAKKIYEKIGFKKIYNYWYRKKDFWREI